MPPGHPAPIDAPPDGLAVSDLAARLADELAAAGALALDCQAALDEVLPAVVEPSIAERLQGLDALAQRLADLAIVVRRLGAGRCAWAPPDALAGLALADLRERLLGRPRVAPQAGEVEVW